MQDLEFWDAVKRLQKASQAEKCCSIKRTSFVQLQERAGRITQPQYRIAARQTFKTRTFLFFFSIKSEVFVFLKIYTNVPLCYKTAKTKTKKNRQEQQQKNHRNKIKMENSTVWTNNFFNNECLINLRQGSASQWPVCDVWSAFQQLRSDIYDTASISIKKPPNTTPISLTICLHCLWGNFHCL